MSTFCVSRFRALALLTTSFAAICGPVWSQSTFGTVLGTVKDPSGGYVVNAKVDLINAGTSASRSTITDADGSYQFVNVDVGTYRVHIAAAGFHATEIEAFDLASRDTKRIDIGLEVATQTTTVMVQAESIVQTDTSNVAVSKGSLELTNLPVAITTRSTGSTSAFSTLTAQPGVQIDNDNNIVVAGALPSQLSITIDGISAMAPGSLTGLSELFPSFNAIEEIRISETLNPAEYGGVADITTVSKSGTNNFHGGAFENLQNNYFNATDTFSHQAPNIRLNNFGFYLGGPVLVPKLYNGRNKTFFFGSYEILRLPKTQTSILSVPTQAMRNGDLSAYLAPQNGGDANLLTGYPGNIIPKDQLDPYAQKLMNLFYPLPNMGAPGAVANNYLASYSIPINSAQGDMRVDEAVNAKHGIFARYTYKNRRILDYPQDANGSPGSPLVGTTSKPEIYNALTVAHNWVITPSLVNELRGGFTAIHRDRTFGITSEQAATALGLTAPPLPGPIPPGQVIPTLSIAGFLGVHAPTSYLYPHENTFQFLDNLTWTKGKHTLKFGGDFRYMSALFTQVFSDYRMGDYTFNGSALGAYLGAGAATPLASFLLGYPDLTTIATVVNPDTDAYAKHYAFYGQDDWKISSSLTLNFGLRWEYHPGFLDRNHNVANFIPDYTSVQNGQTVQGAVILPDQEAFKNLNQGFVESVYPTPVITAAQAGIPRALRFSAKKDFAPRVGFAWRPFKDNKTVVRGGYGRFIQALLSATAINGWAVESSNVGFFGNELDSNGTPIFKLPYSFPSNISQPGTQYFALANKVDYKDPIVEEWNLTLERDLGQGVGVRVSYDGNHSYNIPALINMDQPKVGTSGFDPANVPFPLLAYIWTATNLGYGNYDSGTVSVRKRSRTMQFEGSYTYTRNLTNLYGVSGNPAGGFATEFGNTLSDPYNPSLDYGNTPYSRRHRFLVTFRYELPFGKGRMFLPNANGLVDRMVGGWELSGVGLIQSGPFMTVATLNDPSGTGYNLYNANGGRADSVQGANPRAGQSLDQWINPAAFSDPADNIGRFGNSQQGAVVGPGTKVLSMSLIKRIPLKETVRIELGAQVSNLTNHPNYAPPGNLTLGVPGFGQITGLQTAEGAGPRAIQLTGRVTF